MAAALVHPSAVIAETAEVGDGTRIWLFCHVQAGARIGRDCVLGQNVNVGPSVVIGDGVKVQNNVSIYEGVVVEDEVFLGPSCVFTNVKRPRAFIDRRGAFAQTVVRRGATVGANATVVCGVELGAFCFVGAGAVVTSDVPEHALVVGTPARLLGWVCVCGAGLNFEEVTFGEPAPKKTAFGKTGPGRALCSDCESEFVCVDEQGRQRVKRVSR